MQKQLDYYLSDDGKQMIYYSNVVWFSVVEKPMAGLDRHLNVERHGGKYAGIFGDANITRFTTGWSNWKKRQSLRFRK